MHRFRVLQNLVPRQRALFRPLIQQRVISLNSLHQVPISKRILGFEKQWNRFFSPAVNEKAIEISPLPTIEAEEASRPITGYWYLFTAGLVFTIVVVGGVTRLTESGLSITEWNLIKGMKPPNDESEWNHEFEKYKQTPEYKLYRIFI